ncbi:MAG: FtsB family cell division protein [Candidatus Kapaibacteriota bacterium]
MVLFLVALGVYHLVFSNFGFLNKRKLEKEKKELLNEIKNELNIRDSLENRIKMLETDSLEIEKVAREKYGLVKEGEEIYAITKKKAK